VVRYLLHRARDIRAARLTLDNARPGYQEQRTAFANLYIADNDFSHLFPTPPCAIPFG
jgi:hypothetical protein